LSIGRIKQLLQVTQMATLWGISALSKEIPFANGTTWPDWIPAANL
jgi:hypothetical protein